MVEGSSSGGGDKCFGVVWQQYLRVGGKKIREWGGKFFGGWGGKNFLGGG